MPRTREELRSILARPRARLITDVDQAISAVRSGDLLHVLTDIKKAMRERPATPREEALVKAILLDVQGRKSGRGSINGAPRPSGKGRPEAPEKSACIRCGSGANLVATVLAGFSCCDTCWRVISKIGKERSLDVEIGRFSLPIGGSTIGDLDGIEHYNLLRISQPEGGHGQCST